jgi:hypothetical protein
MAFTQRDARRPGFTHKETIADGITGDALTVPPLPDGGRVTCTIVAGSNTGKVQFTTSPDANVAAATATWQDWPNGTITGNSSDSIISPVTAVRGVSVSGEIVFEVVI